MRLRWGMAMMGLAMMAPAFAAPVLGAGSGGTATAATAEKVTTPSVSMRIRAQHYEDLKALVRQGDVVFGTVVRGSKESATAKAGAQQEEEAEKAQKQYGPNRVYPDTVWSEQKFSEAMDALNAIKDPRVVKTVVFSSIEDLKANLPRIPKDVALISYNSEGGMTPAQELKSLDESVKTFAEIAHRAGYKVAWGPTNPMLVSDEVKRLELARYIDTLTLQHQKVLQYHGVQAFIDLTKHRSEIIRKANPACEVSVQVVIGRGEKAQLIEALNAVKPYVTKMSVFTMRDTKTKAEIMKAVRGE